MSPEHIFLTKSQRIGSGRAGKGRVGQGRAGRGGTGQDRTGQGRAGQGRAGQGRAGQDRTGRDGTGQERTGHGNTHTHAQVYLVQGNAIGFPAFVVCTRSVFAFRYLNLEIISSTHEWKQMGTLEKNM
jgi:hypothetical protein